MLRLARYHFTNSEMGKNWLAKISLKMIIFRTRIRLDKSDSDGENPKVQEGPLDNFSERQGLRRFLDLAE